MRNSLLRRLLRATVKPVLQKFRSQFADPIRSYSIDGLVLFAHEHEIITTTFGSYKRQPDTVKYNDFYFVRLLHEQWGMCNLIDVGVNYGQDLLLISSYKQERGIPGEILGFEPNSRTYALLPHTFRSNGIPARFEHLALGERPGSIILEGVKNNSQGMTTVGASLPNLFEVVEVRTLDRETSHLSGQACFLKLDTQGAEWLILKGGPDFCSKTDIIIRTEFTPEATKGIDGPSLLRYYLERFVVLDARSAREISAESSEAFCSLVHGTYPYGYTDLYLIPKQSPIAVRISSGSQNEPSAR
jgi:FkbM family methyltransferase